MLRTRLVCFYRPVLATTQPSGWCRGYSSSIPIRYLHVKRIPLESVIQLRHYCEKPSPKNPMPPVSGSVSADDLRPSVVPAPKPPISEPTAIVPSKRKEGVKVFGFMFDHRIWPITMSSCLMGCAIGIVVPIMPMMSIELGLSQAQYGMVMSVIGGTRLMVNVPLAAIADGFGRKPLLVIGPLLTSVAMVCTGCVSSLWQLVWWRFVAGATGAAQMTGGQLYLSDISTPSNRARMMAPMGAAFSAGMIIGPGLGGFLAENFGLRVPFFVVGGAVAVVSLLNYLKIKETRHVDLSSSGRHLSKCGQAMKDATVQWRILLKNVDVRSCVMLHCAFWIAASGAQFTLLPILAVQQFGYSLSSLGGLYAFLASLNVIGVFPSAYISDTFGRKLTLVPGAVLASLGIFGTALSSTPTHLTVALLLTGIGHALFAATPAAYMSDIASDKDRSQALAMLRSGGDFGVMVGASLSGVVCDLFGMSTALTINAVLMAVMAINFQLKARESRGNGKTTPPEEPPKDI